MAPGTEAPLAALRNYSTDGADSASCASAPRMPNERLIGLNSRPQIYTVCRTMNLLDGSATPMRLQQLLLSMRDP